MRRELEVVRRDAAANLLGGVSLSTVDRLRAAGRIESFGVGRAVVVTVASIERFLEEERSRAREPLPQRKAPRGQRPEAGASERVRLPDVSDFCLSRGGRAR